VAVSLCERKVEVVRVILAAQKAEIRRIKVWSWPRQIVRETLSRKNLHKKKCWWSGSRCRPWVQAPVQKEKDGVTHSSQPSQEDKVQSLWRKHSQTQLPNNYLSFPNKYYSLENRSVLYYHLLGL
jgi:hypothetical protein